MKNKKIYSAGPSITEREIRYVRDAIENAWYDGAYAYISEFEKVVSEYVGRKYALALPSGTSAIHLALLINGITKGDEVIVPDFTWVGTSAPVSYVGATPVFVDVDKETWCISTKEILKHITERTKAICTVDIFGNMPNYDEIEKIANEKNLVVIEDSAQAMGSSYKGKMAGSFGAVSIFSFHGTKLVTTGEGGMLLTDDVDLFERARKLANYGRDANSTKMFWFDEIGYKYKYTSLQAAMGLAQMERINEILDKRKQIFGWYKEAFDNVQGVSMNNPGEKAVSNYWMSTLIPDDYFYKLKKEDIVEFLRDNNIECRPVIYQLSSMPAYKYLDQKWENPIAEKISRIGINLPSAHNLEREDAIKVSDLLKGFLKKHLRS